MVFPFYVSGVLDFITTASEALDFKLFMAIRVFFLGMRMTGHLDVTLSTVARSLRDSDNLPAPGSRHSASRVSSRVARWKVPGSI